MTRKKIFNDTGVETLKHKDKRVNIPTKKLRSCSSTVDIAFWFMDTGYNGNGDEVLKVCEIE
jgi:hypothetical protein